MPPRDSYKLAKLGFERQRQPGYVCDSTVVHQVHGFRLIRGHAIDRCNELVRIELCRRRSGCDESASRRIHLAVRNAKRIARKNTRVRSVNNCVVMERMSGCMYE